MTLLLFYLTLALVVSFLCSIVEAVILSVSAHFIKMKEMEGKVFAKYLKSLKNKIDRPLAVSLIRLNANAILNSLAALFLSA